MNKVAVALLSMGLPEIERRGIQVEKLIEDLPITMEELRRPSHRIDWDLLVELLERLAPEVGGYEALEEVAAGIYELPWTGLRKLGALGGNPEWLFRMLNRWWGSAFFPNVDQQLTTLPGGDDVLTIRFREEDRLAPGVLWALRGLVREMPRTLGLPDAHVESSMIGRTVRMRIRRPGRDPIWPRLRNRLRRLLSSRALLDQLVLHQEQLAQSYEHLRQQSQQLAESEARYRALMAHTEDLIVVCDTRARVRFASPSVFTRLGIAPGDPLDSGLLPRVHPDDQDRATELFEKVVRSGLAQREDFRVIGADGESFWIEASGQRFAGADGRARILLAARDIGERKRAELELLRDAEQLETRVSRQMDELRRANVALQHLYQRLIEAERMCAANELAGRVSHAINNPLAALIGHVELMLLDTEPGKTPVLERVLGLAQRIRGVVARTLELSREGRLSFSFESPGDILSDVRDEIVERCARREIALELDVADALPAARVDPTLLRAALVSIAENAVDATPPRGRVRLHAQATSSDRVVEFRIQDTGPGIPLELREKILEPFFTTKPEGTGLGLSIARGVIAGHGGRIDWTDAPEGGTQVTVEIPTYA